MPTLSQYAQELLEGVADFARVLSSALGSKGSVRATVRGVEDTVSGDSTVAEDVPDTEMWGLAGLIYRPKAPSAAGHCELVVIRASDELLPIASRDLRFIPPGTIEGEVVLHALGQDGAVQATVRLQPDGTVVVDGTKIELTAGATEKLVKGDSFKAVFNAHTHDGVQAGAGVTGVVTTLMQMTDSQLSSKVKTG